MAGACSWDAWVGAAAAACVGVELRAAWVVIMSASEGAAARVCTGAGPAGAAALDLGASACARPRAVTFRPDSALLVRGCAFLQSAINLV